MKVVRALAHGEQICRPYNGGRGFVMEGDMWWKAAAMCKLFLFSRLSLTIYADETI